MIGSMAELSACMAQVQASRGINVRCELSPAFSARINDAALVEALVTGLPMAQGISYRILRNRGRGTIVTAKVRYRQGMRMLAGMNLTEAESAGLTCAKEIVAAAIPLDDEERFDYIYSWVCRNIRYTHTSPGQKGYERLIGAADVLKDRQANCQGFADVLYLLCGLCGIPCEYRCGRGERRLHVWNAVHLNGEWRAVDASKGARNGAV